MNTYRRRILRIKLSRYIAIHRYTNEQISSRCSNNKRSKLKLVVKLIFFVVSVIFSFILLENCIGARCLLPSNFLVWEVTRPVADCSYCENVTRPIILRNVTRQKFTRYAYSTKPMIVKNAIMHWRAMKEFSYDMFKALYEVEGSFKNFEEDCQFLNFKTDFFSLKEVFSMSKGRVNYELGNKPWYVGWGICHDDIKRKLRKLYNVPEFLPEDAEYPATEHIFMGYEIGAVMHLDYIERLMWQGQVRGIKVWSLAPVPECDSICHKFKFYVEPGDIVLLDTRIWYHATSIPKGQFSITLQSEYG